MNDLPTQLKKNNRTGVTGVAVAERFCHSYIVNDSGKRISRKFSLARYGRDEAIRLAIKWRRDNELKIHGYSVIPEKLIRREPIHQQSAREAEIVRRLLKLAAVEHREKKQREFVERKKNLQKMAGKYIYRIDDLNSGHGWLLRIEIQKESICDMFFRDSRYGSATAALRHARKERENHLARHNVPYAGNRRFSAVLRSTNSTGVTGICRSDFYYHCYIPVQPNKRKTRKFSISKYGEDVAFRLAVEWRQIHEIEVYGGTVLTDKRMEEIFSQKTGIRGLGSE